MELIPPSVVEGYDVSHLHTLATHMTKSVADRAELMGSVNALAAGQEWAGVGRIAQEVPLAEHNVAATTASAALSATAAEATAGAETLYLQKQELVAGLGMAKAAQLEVDEGYNVTDPLAGTPAGTIRASLVQSLQTQLKAGAQAFTATEHSTAQAIQTSMQPVGKVQCFGPDEDHTNCVEQHPDGSITTFPGIPAMQGVWPDAATPGEGKTSMLDNHFKTGPSDPTEPPMPPIGSEANEDMLIGTQSGGASTQSGLGVEDTRLPAMPQQWPPVPSPPPPTCSTDEFYQNLKKATEHTAVEAGGLALLPEEGPAVIPGVVGLIINGEQVAADVGNMANCFTEGVGGQ